VGASSTKSAPAHQAALLRRRSAGHGFFRPKRASSVSEIQQVRQGASGPISARQSQENLYVLIDPF
jgi:hypothetical protein